MPRPLKRSGICRPEKPGIARQYLTEHYSLIPNDSELLNGHILYVYVTNGSNYTITRSILLPVISGESLPSFHYNLVRLVLKSLKRFKNLTNTDQYKKLQSICLDPFSTFKARSVKITKPVKIHYDQDQAKMITDQDQIYGVESTSTCASAPQTIRTRQHCSMCAVLRARFSQTRQLRLAEKEKILLRLQA